MASLHALTTLWFNASKLWRDLATRPVRIHLEQSFAAFGFISSRAERFRDHLDV